MRFQLFYQIYFDLKIKNIFLIIDIAKRQKSVKDNFIFLFYLIILTKKRKMKVNTNIFVILN